MKIFFCETFDDGTIGGSHACMYNLIRHMERSEIACSVGFVAENIYVNKYRALGIPVKVLPIRNPVRSGNVLLRKAINWYRLEYKAGKYLEDFFMNEGFDLVVLNNSIYASNPFVHVCKKLRIPTVVYERGIGPFKHKDIVATEDIQVSIPISYTVRQVLLNNNFKTKIIEMIYDGIDPIDMKSQRTPEQIKADLNIPSKSRVIGMVGNIRSWKGQKFFVEGFIQLARQYDDIFGLLVGGWSEADLGYLQSLKQVTNNAGLEKRIQFLGYRTDIKDLLSVFDVFVHASIKPEPFGMVILEAMAARKPIVATNLGGPLEILNNGECGILVPPGDGQAIEEACKRYLNYPLLAEENVSKAYRRLTGNFHISQTVDRTVNLFNQVLRK